MSVSLTGLINELKSDLLRSIDAIETLSSQPAWVERCNVDDDEFFEDQSERLNDLATKVAQANRGSLHTTHEQPRSPCDF